MRSFNNSKKSVSDHVYADKMIWQCTECNCWSREEFIHVDEPICPVCSGKMSRETKSIRIE